jgi:hypothetical protein
MATTEVIGAFHIAWDAAMATYDAARGAVGTDDVMGTGIDMNSVDHVPAGLWTLKAGVVPDVSPNSNIRVVWTDGTNEVELSYDELSDALRVETVLDGFFDSNFKMWRILTHVETAMTAAGATVTGIGAGPWTWADYQSFVEDLEGRYDPTDEYGLELPGMMG